MSKRILTAFVIASLFYLGGCGDRKFDSSDPDSFNKMMSGMPQREKNELIGDATLAAKALGGDHKLNGYTINDIKKEADNVRKFLRQKNVSFLKETIAEMSASGRTTTHLILSENGVLSKPQPGFIPKEYSIADLNKMLSDLGEAPIPSPSASNAIPVASSDKQQTPEQLFADAARQAADGYAARWKAIQSDPQGFVSKCVNEETVLVVKLGGSNEDEAQERAKSRCRMQLASLKNCMDKPSSKVEQCFTNVFERGD